MKVWLNKLQSSTKHFFLFSGIVCFFLTNSCKPPPLKNVCDPSSKAYIYTLLLKAIIGDQSVQCGISFLNTPANLVYSGSPYTFTQNVAIALVTPTVTGTVTSCSSSPTLPTGLNIGATTCAISGTPSTGQVATAYTITASNYNGNTTASISIATSNSFYTFLGGTGNDQAYSIQQTTDGGYIVAGFANSNIATLGGRFPLNAYSVGTDFLVIKLNSAGAVAFYTFLGGAGADGANSIVQTSDGGYIVAGYANANIATLGGQMPLNGYSGSDDFLVIKLNSAGAVVFYTFLGGLTGGDQADSIVQTSDGGYIVAGYANANIATLGGQMPLNAYSSSFDFLVVKLNSAGAVVFYTFLGSGGNDQARPIRQTSDGGYIVAGVTNANIATLGGQMPLNAFSSLFDFLVIKLNSAGAVVFYTFLGGGGNDLPNSIQQTSDGGYIVAGHAATNIVSLGGQTPLNAYSALTDFLVIKLNASGAVVFYTFLGGLGIDQANSIQQTSDGGYIAAGYAEATIALGALVPLNAYSALSDFLVIKLNSAGAVVFYTFLGSLGIDQANSLQQTTDGGYIVAGFASANIATLGGQMPLNAYSTGNDFLVVKLNANGGF